MAPSGDAKENDEEDGRVRMHSYGTENPRSVFLSYYSPATQRRAEALRRAIEAKHVTVALRHATDSPIYRSRLHWGRLDTSRLLVVLGEADDEAVVKDIAHCRSTGKHCLLLEGMAASMEDGGGGDSSPPPVASLRPPSQAASEDDADSPPFGGLPRPNSAHLLSTPVPSPTTKTRRLSVTLTAPFNRLPWTGEDGDVPPAHIVQRIVNQVHQLEDSEEATDVPLSFRRLLRFLTLSGTVIMSPEAVERQRESRGVVRHSNGSSTPRETASPDQDTRRVLAGRYLLSLFALDTIGWAVGRFSLFEVFFLASEVGHPLVFATLLAVTIENAVEFVSSASVPRLYTWTERTTVLSLHGLIRFTTRAYLVSASLALAFYPIIGIVVAVLRIQTNGTLIWLAITQVIQYPLINQLGDQAVEMALPHWMETFDDLEIVWPGFPLASVWCCGCPLFLRDRLASLWSTPTPLDRQAADLDPWRWNIRAKVTEDSLAYFLNLTRFVIAAIFSVIFLIFRDQLTLRWFALIVFCILSCTTASMLHRGFHLVQRSIVETPQASHNLHETGADDLADSPNRPLGKMAPAEILLVVFATVIFSVPEQAFTAIYTIVALSLSPAIAFAILLVGGIGLILYLAYLVKLTGQEITQAANTGVSSSSSSAKRKDLEAPASPVPGRSRVFETSWLPKYAFITAMLCGASIFLWISVSLDGLGALFFIAALFVIPYVGVTQSLQSLFDSAMFNYIDGSDIVYYKNVFAVLANAPLLVIQWFVLQENSDHGTYQDDDDDIGHYETRQASVVMGLTVAILLIVLGYFVFLDPRRPEDQSVAKLVNAIKSGEKMDRTFAGTPHEASDMSEKRSSSLTAFGSFVPGSS